jgi:hypothetical protein
MHFGYFLHLVVVLLGRLLVCLVVPALLVGQLVGQSTQLVHSSPLKGVGCFTELG